MVGSFFQLLRLLFKIIIHQVMGFFDVTTGICIKTIPTSDTNDKDVSLYTIMNIATGLRIRLQPETHKKQSTGTYIVILYY